MRKLLLSSVFAVFLLSLETGVVKAQTCTAAPECAGLGFTKSKADCPKGALKCPTGDSYFCEEEKIEEKICKIGDIYYSDDTCGAEVDKTKTALGVVVYITDGGKHGQVMAPWPVDEDGKKTYTATVYWSTDYTDIINLRNYSTEAEASKDFNSCSNTRKIISKGAGYPAALAASLYTLTTETKGKWCLPAAGVMTSIYNNIAVIREALSKLNGAPFADCCAWSSSEQNDSSAWLSYDSFYGLGANYKDGGAYVRPVIEF